MDRFVAAVRQQPCVDNVRTNVRTGSILIDHKGGTRDHFKGVFEDIGCILRGIVLPELPAGETRLDLPQAVADLDVRLGLVGLPFKSATTSSWGNEVGSSKGPHPCSAGDR
jgi:hypothetical protein